MKFTGKAGNGPMNKLLNFGGNTGKDVVPKFHVKIVILKNFRVAWNHI